MIIKNNISNNKKLVIFDIDGTLVYYDTLNKLVKESLQIYGFEPLDEYVLMQSKGVINILNDSITKKCFNYKNMYKYWEDSMPFLKNVKSEDIGKTMLGLECKYLKIYNGVVNALESINITKVCSTNWFYENQKKKLDKFDLTKYFKRIYTCEETYAKPSKEHFEYILNCENVTKEEAVMIGDSESDIICSKYGIDSILIDYKECKQNIYQMSTCVINSPQDLKKILKK